MGQSDKTCQPLKLNLTSLIHYSCALFTFSYIEIIRYFKEKFLPS